eukprot:m.335969 g.335969  ORF g.335969 m.335969 type:complete len:159 (+) comp27777_c0_seq12:760-1236(+)
MAGALEEPKVWETTCILRWGENVIHAWLKSECWDDHFTALDVATGNQLASSTVALIDLGPGAPKVRAGRIHAAVGLVLERQHDGGLLPAPEFKRLMRARGTPVATGTTISPPLVHGECGLHARKRSRNPFVPQALLSRLEYLSLPDVFFLSGTGSSFL